MIKCAKYVGLTIFATIFLAMPALLVLSYVFNWDDFWSFFLTFVVVFEILLTVSGIKVLADKGIL